MGRTDLLYRAIFRRPGECWCGYWLSNCERKAGTTCHARSSIGYQIGVTLNATNLDPRGRSPNVAVKQLVHCYAEGPGVAPPASASLFSSAAQNAMVSFARLDMILRGDYPEILGGAAAGIMATIPEVALLHLCGAYHNRVAACGRILA